MGKKSIRENKSIYQLAREDAELTREKASEQMVFVSEDRIEKIESGKLAIHPDDVLAMSECYGRPYLTNYYCSNECPIGRKYVPELEEKDLGQITLETINAINQLEQEKARLIEIAVDGKISSDEKRDFVRIKEKLDSIMVSVQTLRLWIEAQEEKELL